MGCGRVECVGTMIIISQPSIHYYIKELFIAGHTIGEAKSAVVVDVDILVEEVGAGTGVDFRGRTFPLVVAEHPLP